MTLAELLTTLALVGLLGAATAQIVTGGQRAWAVVAGRAESQQNARVAATRFVLDVRAAGHGRGVFDAVAVAEPHRVVLQQDVDGDGVIAAAGEQVTWRLAGSILRRDAGGGAQPVINGVRRFELRYFAGDGTPTTVATAVRSIGIALATEPARPELAGGATDVATRVRLRNR